MRAFNRYIEMLGGNALRLYEQDGIRDPSIVEIACRAMHLPPPTNPISWPDYVGGEIIHGVAKRLAQLRAMLEERGHQCAPVGFWYYQHGMRGRFPEVEQVMACLPSGGPRRLDDEGRPLDNRPYGLRFVLDNEEDPIYQAYLRSNGMSAATYLERTERKVLTAHARGAITTTSGLQLAEDIGRGLKITPAELKNRIGNGHDPEEEPTPV